MTELGTPSIEAAALQAEHYANLARTGGVGLLWDSADEIPATSVRSRVRP
jgi:hypothetical protein